MDCLHLNHIRLGPQVWTEEDEGNRRKAVDRIVFALIQHKENKLHYKNGREAKNGDKVLLIPSYGAPVVGILYDAVAGNDYCNGRIAPTSPTDPSPNLKEVLHWDDVTTALTINGVPDVSVVAQ